MKVPAKRQKEGVAEGGEGEYCRSMPTSLAVPEKGGDRQPTYVWGPRTARLRELMAEFNWSAPDVGKLLDRSPAQVRKWSCGIREPPKHMMTILEYKASEARTKTK